MNLICTSLTAAKLSKVLVCIYFPYRFEAQMHTELGVKANYVYAHVQRPWERLVLEVNVELLDDSNGPHTAGWL